MVVQSAGAVPVAALGALVLWALVALAVAALSVAAVVALPVVVHVVVEGVRLLARAAFRRVRPGSSKVGVPREFEMSAYVPAARELSRSR